jgi:hypothetical protein
MKIPVLNIGLDRPTRGSLAWYATVATMSAAGLIEWPLAAIVVTSHAISQNARSQTAAGAAEGAESVAG